MKRRPFALSAKNARPSPLTKTELDAAKTVLRRRGYVVYDAEVTDGLQWRGFIRCDHRTLTPSRVIEMAKDIEAAP